MELTFTSEAQQWTPLEPPGPRSGRDQVGRWARASTTMQLPATDLDDRRPRPLVSVVIPCYRYGHYLPGCVASALDQPGIDLEIVIVDDASPDDSGVVAERLAAADPRIRVIRHTSNTGHIRTYNDGLGAARGTYVLLLSADDLLVPGALSRAAALMEDHPSVGLVYGHPVRFVDVPPPNPRTSPTGWTIWPGRHWLERSIRTATNFLVSPEAVMRTEVLRAAGGYRAAELPHAGDYEMWLRAASLADVGRVNGADQAWYRMHEANMHNSVFQGDVGAGLVVDLEQRRLSQDLLFEWAGDGLDGHAALRADGRLALATEALDRAGRAYAWGISDSWPVDALEAMALETHPAAGTTREARALAWRRRLGARWSRRNPAYRAQTLAYHAAEWHKQRQRDRHGIL